MRQDREFLIRTPHSFEGEWGCEVAEALVEAAQGGGVLVRRAPQRTLRFLQHGPCYTAPWGRTLFTHWTTWKSSSLPSLGVIRSGDLSLGERWCTKAW